jgi:hypothetical protein
LLDQLDKTAAEKLAGGEHDNIESDVDQDATESEESEQSVAATVAFDSSTPGLTNGLTAAPKIQDGKLQASVAWWFVLSCVAFEFWRTILIPSEIKALKDEVKTLHGQLKKKQTQVRRQSRLERYDTHSDDFHFQVDEQIASYKDLMRTSHERQLRAEADLKRLEKEVHEKEEARRRAAERERESIQEQEILRKKLQTQAEVQADQMQQMSALEQTKEELARLQMAHAQLNQVNAYHACIWSIKNVGLFLCLVNSAKGTKSEGWYDVQLYEAAEKEVNLARDLHRSNQEHFQVHTCALYTQQLEAGRQGEERFWRRLWMAISATMFCNKGREAADRNPTFARAAGSGGVAVDRDHPVHGGHPSPAAPRQPPLSSRPSPAAPLQPPLSCHPSPHEPFLSPGDPSPV